MPKNLYVGLSFFFFLLIPAYTLKAQNPPTSVSLSCGIENLSRPQALSLSQMANFALQRKRASGAAFSAITYIPIRPHILRRSDGSGGFSLASLNYVIATTNSYYLLNGFGIQFYFAGTSPDYIDNDTQYNTFSDEYAVAQNRDATNALNQYYVNQFSSPGLGGYAYYPADAIYSTRSFILTGPGEYDEDLGNRLIPHELGHTFNLIHTFGNNNGYGGSTELVTRGAGANCSTDADLVCDTPADPYNMTGAYLTYPNGCPQYDPNSTARDANGAAYNPSITNIMSYYFPCTHDFTPGQYDRMQAGLALRQSHTSYTLNAPPSNVVAPSNLTGTQNGYTVALTWQDNADNEMGYFIERSTSPSSGFVPIGGVAPNVTTFTDTKALLQTLYYRIRPSNTTTGSLSPTFSIQVSPPLVTGLNTTNITGNSAQLNWNSLGNGATYDLQWRVVGEANWITYSSISTTSYGLYGLTANTNYEWQVKASTGTQYAPAVTFMTPCSVPTGLYTYTTRLTASLNWNYNSGQTFTVQWRPKGTEDWNTSAGLVSGYYSLTGLTPASVYEWRVQATCINPPVATTDFTSIQSFTTLSCQLPYTISVTDIFSNSARLYWYDSYYESGKTYEIRYRPVGTTTWTANSVTASYNGTYTLTGLTNNTTYEWQFRSLCTPTESSDYSSINTFTTTCRIPTGLSTNVTATIARLYWYTNGYSEPGATYELQHRPVGSTDWVTVSGIPSSFYSLSGLATNVSYEWRVRNVCTPTERSDYSATNTFTTACIAPSPYNLYASFISSSSVQFNWYVQANDPAMTYELRYRPVGAVDWATVSSLTVNSGSYGVYQATALAANSQYEWQLRTLCTGVQSSTYVNGPNFTTQCAVPYLYTLNYTGVNSATIAWNQTGLDVSYEFRYRKAGTTDWTTVTNLTSTTIALSGLTGNTQYETQVRTLCMYGLVSDFSFTYSFYTAQCSVPYSLYTTNIRPTSARVYWSFSQPNPDLRYEVRYRPVGTSDWTSLYNLTIPNYTGAVSLTNLASNTQYEWQVKTQCSPTESSAFSSSVLFQTPPYCPIVYTVRTGYWTDATIWSCGYIPDNTDVVQIKHLITIPYGYAATAKQIGFDIGQTLRYEYGAQLRIGF
ncbi:hypothetical protein GCM10028805_12550 [Spirosoma harenae]